MVPKVDPTTHPSRALATDGRQAPRLLLLLIVYFLGTGTIQATEKQLALGDQLSSALETAAANNRPVFVVFGASWCPNCRSLREKTFRNRQVIAALDNYERVGIDIGRQVTVAHRYGIEAIPQIFFLDSSGKIRARIEGYLPPDEFLAALARAENALAAGQPQTAPVDVTGASQKTPVAYTGKGYRARSICFAQVGYGPLSLQTQSPFQSLRLGLVPRTPSTLAKGQQNLRLTTTWTNTWADEPGDYHLDYEALHFSASWSYGLSDTLEGALAFETRSRFGGVMDGFIQGFHNLFNIDQGGRDLYPKNDFAFQVGDLALDDGDTGFYSHTLAVSIQHNVTCGAHNFPAFSYSFTARTELGRSPDLEGGIPLDLGASAAVARRLHHFYLYFTLGYSWFGRDAFRSLPLRRTQISALAAVEWRFRPRSSLLLQYVGSEGLTDLPGALSAPSNEVTLGFKHEFRKSGRVLELGIIENVITFGNSPDFGIHFGFSQRF